MLRRLIAATTICLLSAAPTARAGSQLFEGSWSVKAFGNECVASKVGTTGGTAMLTRYPNCNLNRFGSRSGESEFYSIFGLPLGVQCNPNQPRCNFSETPTDGAGNFAPLGGSQMYALFCGAIIGPRPAKGATPTTGGKNKRPIAPLYRNPAFFTAGGAPNQTECTAISTDGFGGKGPVMLGHPITGSGSAATTAGSAMGGFQFAAAAAGSGPGLRATGVVGELGAIYPYVYSYTYATLRNDSGFFGPGKGPGSFSLPYKVGGNTVAKIAVKQGAAKFGGTMKMLGALTTKTCYYRAGGCSLNYNDWRYDAIGAAAYTSGGVVTRGYLATWCLHPGFFGECGTIEVGPTTRIPGSGARFPWTTGSVTVTAVGRGPHKTVHYAKGYDNRTPTSGKGTIQLVSPTLTRWLEPGAKFETGGIGILRLKFAPEPRAWLMLVAGVSCLGVLHRWRG